MSKCKQSEGSELESEVKLTKKVRHKVIGGDTCTWCIRHPKGPIPTFILPPLNSKFPTAVYLNPYTYLTTVLLESCFGETANNTGNTRCA